MGGCFRQRVEGLLEQIMGEFFHGWRRKLGCVTLVMACVFMGGWVRSQFTFDDLEVPFGNAACGVTSMGGGLDFYRLTTLDQTSAWSSTTYSSGTEVTVDADGTPMETTPWSAQHQIEWRRDWAGFHFGVSREGNRRDEDCMIPYWSIVIPLTLISYWLLLPKPRRSSQQDPGPTLDQNVDEMCREGLSQALLAMSQ